MRYEVETQFVLNGKFFVEADSLERARELVKDRGGMKGGNIQPLLGDDVCDWNFDILPDKIIGKTRKFVVLEQDFPQHYREVV